MKKKVSDTPSFLNDKRFQKTIKKNRHKKYTKPLLSNFQISILSQKHFSEFIRFTKKVFNVTEAKPKKLSVPKDFSFGVNFDLTIEFYRSLNYALYEKNEVVIIDFTNCKRMKIGAATFLQITLLEFLNFTDKFNMNHYGKLSSNFKIINSKELRINKMLFSLRLITDFEGIDKINESSFFPLNLTIGAKKRYNYNENIKGKIGKKINSFVNQSMRGFGYELDEEGQRTMLNLMGEILGNAEDHSLLNNYYVNGVSFLEKVDDNPIIELNLAIINLGYSFYEGFINVKDRNIDINEKMEKLYNIHSSYKNINQDKYSKESLFTLYGLQEGISRLKFKDQSRGNGTMNFIRSFMNLGEFGEEDRKYQSKLNIISGRTVIECTNDFKPYCSDEIFYLSLNKEQDLKKLPSKKAIFTHTGYFPGTILQVRIFMSKEYFKRTVQNGK